MKNENRSKISISVESRRSWQVILKINISYNEECPKFKLSFCTFKAHSLTENSNYTMWIITLESNPSQSDMAIYNKLLQRRKKKKMYSNGKYWLSNLKSYKRYWKGEGFVLADGEDHRAVSGTHQWRTCFYATIEETQPRMMILLSCTA
jgi:hypothetical protein